MRILICGLPGSGKTTLAKKLAKMLGAVHFNADEIRQVFPGLGFSHADRMKQSLRMGWLASRVDDADGIAICDFICPTEDTRHVFDADFTIWMDTIERGRFADTDAMWEAPADYDIRIGKFGSENLHEICASIRMPMGDPSVQMLGRFQPWHEGHRALFIKSLEKCGHVTIMVRQLAKNDRNPYNFTEVKARIERDLAEYTGSFDVIAVPNIVAIHYGRDVGYAIERIELSKELEAVSATKLRAQHMSDYGDII